MGIKCPWTSEQDAQQRKTNKTGTKHTKGKNSEISVHGRTAQLTKERRKCHNDVKFLNFLGQVGIKSKLALFFVLFAFYVPMCLVFAACIMIDG